MKFLARWRTRKARQDAENAYVSERHGVRSLHIGSDTVQSSMRIAKPYDLELSYTRSMMAFLLFVPIPKSALMIGLGGGSLAKFVHHRLAATRLTVIEVSHQVVGIARRYFQVPEDVPPRFQVIVGDGSEFVTREDVSADLIFLDGYDGDSHAEELANGAFYCACRARLAPGGVLVVNLWGGDSLFNTLLGRIRSAFPDGTLSLPAERPGNVIVFAFRDKPTPFEWTALGERAKLLEDEYGLEFERFVESLRKMNEHDEARLYA
jgi:spermidine synthase